MQPTVIEFEKRRDFGSVIGDSLQFFARNFKSFLLGFLTYVGPLFLAGAILQVLAMQSIGTFFNPEQTPNVTVVLRLLTFLPFIYAASIMAIALTCGIAQKHIAEPGSILGENLWGNVAPNFLRAFVASVIMAIILILPLAVLIGGGMMIHPIVGIMLILVAMPFMIYLMVPLTMFLYAYVLERGTIGGSLERAFRLVRDKWWQTFGVLIVLSLLASIAASVLSVPAYILMFIQTLASATEGDFSEKLLVWMGIVYACVYLGSLFTSMYQSTGMIMQYYSLREQKEGGALLRRIEQLDTETPRDDR